MESRLHLLKLANLRRLTYGLLGTLLLYPREAAISAASEAAANLRLRSRTVDELAFYGPWERFLCRVSKLEAARVHGLQKLYLGLFGGGGAVERAPLHESSYLDHAEYDRPPLLGDLEAEYAAVGLAVSSFGDQTSDHAAVEMEYVSFLCRHEEKAWEAGDLPWALEAIDRQQRFLEQHPSRWFPTLSRKVDAHDGEGLYAATARAAHALVVHDVDFLEALVERLETDANAG